MKKPFNGALCAGLVVFAASVLSMSSTFAAEDSDFSMSGKFSKGITLASDYRFRGVSQTFGDPAIQGFAELNFSNNFYIGTWASTIDKQVIPDNRGIEWDIYGGYRFVLTNGIKFDVGLLQYLYWGESSLATLEGYTGVTWEFLTFKYSQVMSNKFFGSRSARGSQYFDLTGKYPVGAGFKAFAHYGIQRIKSSNGDYSDYSIGVEKDWKSATWMAGVFGTDSRVNAVAVNGRTRNLGARGLVLSVTKTF